MWLTLIFSAAGLFLIWTLFALWHLRWVHRLQALETFTSAARSTAASSFGIRALLRRHGGAG